MKYLRVAAYLFVVAMGATGLWRQEQILRDDKAARCVASWEVRADTRTAISSAAQVPVESLIAVIPDADPAQVEAYRAEAQRRIDDAAGELPDPDCDLDAARDRLGD